MSHEYTISKDAEAYPCMVKDNGEIVLREMQGRRVTFEDGYFAFLRKNDHPEVFGEKWALQCGVTGLNVIPFPQFRLTEIEAIEAFLDYLKSKHEFVFTSTTTFSKWCEVERPEAVERVKEWRKMKTEKEVAR